MGAESGFFIRPRWLLLAVAVLAGGSVWRLCPWCGPGGASAAPPAPIARGDPIASPAACPSRLDPAIEEVLALLREETQLTDQEKRLVRDAIESGEADDATRRSARDALDALLLGGGDPGPPLETLTAFLRGRVPPAPLESPGPRDATHEPTDSPYQDVAFDLLAGWEYVWPEKTPATEAEKQKLFRRIPEKVRKLDGARVAVTGFMIPIDIDRDAVLSFLLVRYPFGCCYTQPPQMNEWVFVKMAKGKTTQFLSHVPVPALGTLSVGDEFDRGTVTSVYRMVADDVILPVTGR